MVVSVVVNGKIINISPLQGGSGRGSYVASGQVHLAPSTAILIYPYLFILI